MTLGIASANHTSGQVENEVKSWLDSWLKTVTGNIQAIEAEIAKKIQEPILNAYVNIADIVSEIDQQLVNKWASYHETATQLGITPWEGYQGQSKVPKAVAAPVFQQPATIHTPNGANNPVDSGSFNGPNAPRSGGSSGQGVNAPPISFGPNPPIIGNGNQPPQTTCPPGQRLGALLEAPWVQCCDSLQSLFLGTSGTNIRPEWQAAGLVSSQFTPSSGTWYYLSLCAGSPITGGGGGGGGIGTGGGGGGGGGSGGGIGPPCSCPPPVVQCPPPVVNVTCGPQDTPAAIPFPVDEDQPLAFVLGDWDDEYFDKIEPFTGDMPRRFRNGEDPQSVESDLWKDWPK